MANLVLILVRLRYTLLKYDKCFSQRADTFSDDEMAHGKYFSTVTPLYVSHDMLPIMTSQSHLVDISLKLIHYIFRLMLQNCFKSSIYVRYKNIDHSHSC